MKIPATWTERDVITTSSSSSSNQKRKNKPQQCLRFAPTVDVVEIPSRFDYSQEELEASWFQAEDYDDFREHSYMTMGLHRAGLLPAPGHCMRGLEGRLREVSREREWTRYHATAAVLNEQHRQYMYSHSHRMGSCGQQLHGRNPQAIADLYHAVAWKSQYAAYAQAMLDEQEQRALLDSTTTPAIITTTSSNALYHHNNKGPASPRRSDAKNLLRKVIDIERNSFDPSSTLFLPSAITTTTTTENNFDINSFFQELTVSAQ